MGFSSWVRLLLELGSPSGGEIALCHRRDLTYSCVIWGYSRPEKGKKLIALRSLGGALKPKALDYRPSEAHSEIR